MRSGPMIRTRIACRAALAAAGVMVAAFRGAQAQVPGPAPGERDVGWRLGATAGALAPMSALIRAADGRNTELAAGPLFGLDVQYMVGENGAIYADALAGFSTVTLGSSIRPAVVGPSNQVILLGGVAGALVSLSASDRLQFTFRLGGGIKGYLFDLAETANQWRATGDFGFGIRGLGGPLEVNAEVRYLPSSFDQAKLPIRSIVPQSQRQNDLLFTVGVTVRP